MKRTKDLLKGLNSGLNNLFSLNSGVNNLVVVVIVVLVAVSMYGGS